MAETGLSDNKMTGIPSKTFAFETFLAEMFLVAMFIVYPLVFHNYYYDIVTCKYIVLIVITVLLLLSTLILDGKTYLKKFYLMPSDYAVIFLFVINILSVAGSECKVYALNGADGRFNGLVTVFLYVIIYFIVSRGIYDRNRFPFILAVGSIPVSVLGILNFFDIDILGFYDGLYMEQKQFYISTLGHVNVYSGYFALTIPILLITYLKAQDIKRLTFYFLASLLNMTALLCGGCESAAIIMITAVFCSVLYCKHLHTVRWMGIVFCILIGNKLLIFINKQQTEQRVLSNTVKFLGDNRIIAGIVIICLCLVPIEIFMSRRGEIKQFKYGVIFLGIVILVGYSFTFIYFSVIDRKTDLYGLEEFLRFSDAFGSYRGYIWRVVMQEFRRLPLYQILFGIGTDTLYPYLAERYGEAMYNVTMAYYDNAHNEFLQYLITTGIAGLATYAAVLFLQIKKAVKKADKVILCGVICYLVQSVVNLNQVVTTPLFVVMLSML